MSNLLKPLSEYMPILKVASSNTIYPIYAPYINSDFEKVRTCNDEVYIEIEHPLPFGGSTNIFVLSELLNILPDDFDIKIEPDTIYITSNTFKNKISLLDIDFPRLENPDIEYIVVTDDIYRFLKTAILFSGREEYSYIYIDQSNICSSDKRKVIVYDIEESDFDGSFIGINSKILSILKPGMEIGSKDGNTVVRFDSGFAIFSIDDLSEYPIDKIRDYVSISIDDTKLLCNVALLQDCIKKVSYIFFGEGEKFIHLKNNNNNIMTISAESAINGYAEITVDTKTSMKFELDIDSSFIRNIPIDYDVYISSNRWDRLCLLNDKSSIILMGAEQ